MSDNFSEIISFIRKIYQKPEGFIPLHSPVFAGNEKKYVLECIDSTFVSSVGKFVDSFETAIANYTNCKKAVACVNGTNALHLALVLVGVTSEHEVITQPLTFIATLNAIKYCGAEPIFVDVDKETLGLSPSELENFLLNNATVRDNNCINLKTGKIIKACLPVHTFGHACKIDRIADICKAYKISLIEDAAEAVGSFYKNKHLGTFAEIGVLSFNGNKTITTGGGGMLLFNDEDLAQKAKHLTTQAKVPHVWQFSHDAVAYNYRMPNINAALGLAQLENLENMLKSKRAIAFQYMQFFNRRKNPAFITEPNDCNSNYWLNGIIFENSRDRDAFLEYSNKQEIMTRPAWQLMNKLPMFTHCQHSDLSNSNWISDRLVNIPSSPISL